MKAAVATRTRPKAPRRSKGAPPPASSSTPRIIALHDAGSHSRRTLGWQAPTTSPNSGLWDLTTLRDRSRAATRNDGYAKGAIDTLVTNIIGTGVRPLSKADDPAFRKAQQALWTAWTDESDSEGQLDFYGQQTQATRTWLTAGESFVRLRPRQFDDGFAVPLQLQVLEPESCPHTYTTTLPNGNLVHAGIEFNRLGRRVAYYFYATRPRAAGEDFDRSRMVRVPAAEVIHLYDPLRPGQRRGLPLLSAALMTLHELDKFDDATLLRQQLANMFVGFLTKDSTVGGADEAMDPLTGGQVKTHDDKPVLTLEPGLFHELAPGEGVEFAKPPEAAQTYPDFMRQQLYRACAATGVPYELMTGDMSNVNDRSIRVVLQEFRRRIQMWQHQVVAFQLCRRVWQVWNDRAFLAGALPFPLAYVENPRAFTKVIWMPQGWPYIHPLQDVEAKTKEVRAGFTSRSQVVSDQGEDAEEIDREQREDNTRADELQLRYDSDGRQDAKASPTPPESEDPPPPAPPGPPGRPPSRSHTGAEA